jgi:hypothetical protein
MKLGNDGFSIPLCVFDDNLPDKALVLLCYLFKCSDIPGRCSPGYTQIMRDVGIGSRNTVNRNLSILRKRGWFDIVKKKGHRNTIYFLTIPARFSTFKQTEKLLKIRLLPNQS